MDKLDDIACTNPDCGKKNLFPRRWRKDILCGFCFQEYIREGKRLVVMLLGKKQPLSKARKQAG